MRTLYLDTFSGIAGDMMVGLLLDLGLDPDLLRERLALLPLSEYELTISRERRGGIEGCRFVVDVTDDHPHRHWSAIDRMLSEVPLAEAERTRARGIFRRLAEAEARVHGIPVEKVHFHEVGAVDAIVDIVGTAIGLEVLQIDRIVVSPLPLGHGFVQTEHGRMPLPAPAVPELLKGMAVVADSCDKELVTPTGAAIVAAMAESGSLPAMQIERTGYGVGGRELADRPNLLRGFLGCAAGTGTLLRDRVALLETHIDDASPEILGYLLERLFAEGALDAGYQALQMKKGRPGVRLTVVAPVGAEERFAALIMVGSGSIGVRWQTVDRFIAPRKPVEIETPFGSIRAKSIILPTGERIVPEFEECRRIALERGIPLPQVYEAIIRAIPAGEDHD